MRQRRRELAKAQRVPPYVIFHDASMTAMLGHRPRTLEEFSQISGVGTAKLHRYGQTFLDIICAHARAVEPRGSETEFRCMGPGHEPSDDQPVG